jgi:hypothetical protein
MKQFQTPIQLAVNLFHVTKFPNQKNIEGLQLSFLTTRRPFASFQFHPKVNFKRLKRETRLRIVTKWEDNANM